MVDYRHPINLLLLFGLVLLPFSTGVGSGVPVLSFGLPWLGLAAILALPGALRFTTDNKIEYVAAFLASAVVLLEFASCWIPDQPIPSLSRWLPNAVGWILFLRVLSCPREQSPALVLFLLRGLCTSATVLALYFLANLGVGYAQDGVLVFADRTNTGDMALPWAASNVVAATLILGVIATWLLSLRTGQSWRLIAAVSLQSLAIVSTVSRGATVLLLLFFGAELLSARQYRTFAAALAIGVALLGALALTQEDAVNLLAETRGNQADAATLNGRFDEWHEKAGYWLKHPLEPLGYYATIRTFVHTSHNVVLAFLVEQGPVAVLLLGGFYLWIGRAIWIYMPSAGAQELRLRNCCLIGWLVIGINVQIEDPYYTQPYSLTLWLLLAVWMKLVSRDHGLRLDHRI